MVFAGILSVLMGIFGVKDEYFPLDYDQENGTNSVRDEVDEDRPPTMPSELCNEVDSLLKPSTKSS